jgi:hypothetical protein
LLSAVREELFDAGVTVQGDVQADITASEQAAFLKVNHQPV